MRPSAKRPICTSLIRFKQRNICSVFHANLWYLDLVRLPEFVTLSLKTIDDNDINATKLVAAERVCHSRHSRHSHEE